MYVGDPTVVMLVPSRKTSYPVTATSSVEADQVRVTCVELWAFAARFAGTEGALVSAGVVALTDALEAEVTWLLELLARARAARALAGELEPLLAGQPPAEVLGPARERVRDALEQEQRDAAAEVAAALDGARYFALLDALDPAPLGCESVTQG